MTVNAIIGTLPPAEQDHLTAPERILLDKLSEGLTFRQIDHALQLETGTAYRLRKHPFRKIGVRTRHEASATVHPTSHVRQAELRWLLEVHYRLTRRESDVLILLFSFPELSRRQIGAQLGISDNTVRLTINRSNKKLGVKTRAAAIYAIYTSLQQGKGTGMQTNEMNTQEQAIQAAMSELVTRWGYRDISALITAWKLHDAEQSPEEAETSTYLCVLQTPEGGPVYCRTAKRLFRELVAAQARNEPHEQCPAPDPAHQMWMVVGNFDIEDEDERTQR